MKSRLRKALAELLLQAIRSRAASAALDALLAYCRAVNAKGSFNILITDLACGEEAFKPLAAIELFRLHVGAEPRSVELLPEFRADLPAMNRLAESYIRALAQLQKRQAGNGLEWVLEEAAALFNEGLFFEVHELLEEAWMPEQDPRRKRPLQGLIQIAVAFHHLFNRNYRGAIRLLQQGYKKAEGGGSCFHGLKLEAFLEGVQACREALERLGPAAFEAFSPRMVPKMELTTRP